MNYNARDLAVGVSEDDIWNIPKTNHQVTFDDGTVTMSWQKVIYSHYYWRLHREFPGAPIVQAHALIGDYSHSVHLNLGSRLFWDVKEGCNSRDPNLVWAMSKVWCEITNSIYNMACTRLSTYATTACIYDIVEVLEDPEVAKAKREYMERVPGSNYTLPESEIKSGIDNVHSIVKDTLYGKGGKHLSHNGLRKLCKAGIINPGQMLQLIGPRGFLHDIDGNIFKYPIDVGYSEGLFSLYDSAIESRSAARALFMNTNPLRASEYFNRRMQLLCSVVHSVVGKSCSGWRTIPTMVGDDDDMLLKGKNYMEGKKVITITGSTKHLAGKVIQLRSMIGCNNEDSQTVCETCLGWTHNIIQPRTNVGYALSTASCAKLSQLMLSTKHYEASAASKYLKLGGSSNRWFRQDPKDKSRLHIRKEQLKRRPLIRIDSRCTKHLNQINEVDVEELAASRITECNQIGIVTVDSNGEVNGPFDVVKMELGGAGAYLTTEALRFIKSKGWTSGSGYIEFSLEGWNDKDALFCTPRRGDNIHLFLKEIESFITPSNKSERGIKQFSTGGGALAEFVSLMRKRLDINIVLAEIFIRACMAQGSDTRNYLLPRANDEFRFVPATECLYNRSLAVMLAFEYQQRSILDPNWFEARPRVTHMLDNILEH